MIKLTERKEWQALLNHKETIAQVSLRSLFEQDAKRKAAFTLKVNELTLDYSKNILNNNTLDLFEALLHSLNISEKIAALFNGAPINTTEGRPALHTALRDKNGTPIWINGKNIAKDIALAKEKMQVFVTDIHTQKWRGITGKPIQHVVNIGIGGSYAGPMMCTFALKQFAISNLQFHFIASVDHDHVDDVLAHIDPETTLFIVSSKSFSTLETLANARIAANWLQYHLGEAAFKHHFIAITAQEEKALAFGIKAEHIFPLGEWVGGRYSIWSAIGLPLMLMIGVKHFEAFLLGGYEMDEHFRSADFKSNMPIILALLNVWYINFFDARIQAIIPYTHRLRHLIAYLQQAEMESNGKRVDVRGQQLSYVTSPVLFGEEGSVGQHAYHQLLHQGQHFIPVDFIVIQQSADILKGSALSQAEALMQGKTYAEAFSTLLASHSLADAEKLAPHQVITGNKPSNILWMEKITPKNLGMLIALYEHKIFIQGMIWGINPFDQWGVELGKQLLPDILQSMNALETVRKEDVAEIN